MSSSFDEGSGVLLTSPSLGGTGGVVQDKKSNDLHKMAQKIARHFPAVQSTNCTALKRAMNDPVLGKTIVVLDVRKPEEVAVSMIPGALTQEEFDRQKGELKGKSLVCYCTIGYRSSAACAKLKAQGFDAKNLEGGIVRWAQKRYPLVPHGGTEEVKRIHTYAKDWGLQPDDYEVVVFKSPAFATLRSFLPKWLGGN